MERTGRTVAARREPLCVELTEGATPSWRITVAAGAGGDAPYDMAVVVQFRSDEAPAVFAGRDAEIGAAVERAARALWYFVQNRKRRGTGDGGAA